MCWNLIFLAYCLTIDISTATYLHLCVLVCVLVSIYGTLKLWNLHVLYGDVDIVLLAYRSKLSSHGKHQQSM